MKLGRVVIHQRDSVKWKESNVELAKEIKKTNGNVVYVPKLGNMFLSSAVVALL